MHYLKFGNSKRFIVFLHGWGADLNSFLWLKDYFFGEYSLIFLDFDGFGKTGEPKEALNLFDYVLNLKKLLDNFDIEEICFVAHSFGGRVAIKYLFYFQFCFKKVNLCLVDSAGILPRRTLSYKLKVSQFKRLKRKALLNDKFKIKLEKFGSSDYKVLSPVMKKTFVNIVNEDLTKFAKFLKCETLIVWGENDKETKPYMARKFNKLIKNSKLVFLKNAGHFSFLEKKEEFIIILDTFLKNL
ncbi:MAG: alpha/beta hydrolase [Clostridia bacterium]|nr:alpha/beta hydrolase [Clostridia bacterium]